MNIVMVTNDFLPAIGGISEHVHNLARTLALGQDKVAVLHLSHSDQVDERAMDQPYTYLRAPYPLLGATIYRLLPYFKAVLLLLKLKTAWSRIDVIHYHDLAHTARFLIVITKLPYLAEAIHIWTNHSSQFVVSVAGGTGIPRWVRYGLSKSDAMIGPSPELVNLTENLWSPPCGVHYVPNGVDLESFNPAVYGDRGKWGVASDAFLVLCPRRTVPKNGIDVIARALESVVTNSQIPFVFMFLGMEAGRGADPDYVAYIEETVAPYAGHVKLVEWVSPLDMPELYKIADIVAIPSFVEAVSLAAIEAAACGRPIVASNVGGLPEIVKNEETGLLVQAGDEEALANAILRLAHDSALRLALGESAAELAKKYSWERVAHETRAVYVETRNWYSGESL